MCYKDRGKGGHEREKYWIAHGDLRSLQWMEKETEDRFCKWSALGLGKRMNSWNGAWKEHEDCLPDFLAGMASGFPERNCLGYWGDNTKERNK